MRVRIFELRLIAAGLAILWAVTAILILVGYRPGGPIDLVVGLAVCLTVPIPLAAVIWPPLARGTRAFAGVVWLGLGASLLLIPSIGSLIGQLVAGGPQRPLPSAEAAYPWALALSATSLFAGLGVARRLLGESSLRRQRMVIGVAIAMLATTIVGLAFAGVAIANDLALRDSPAASSRFGPTHPQPNSAGDTSAGSAGAAVDPPLCDATISAGRGASVEMTLDGEVDGHSIGSASLSGLRVGSDFRWRADVATDRTLGLYGAARIGSAAWILAPRTSWRTTSLDSIATDSLDLQAVTSALPADVRRAAEDRGLEYVEGARGRHCRIEIDGPVLATAFPELAWLAGPADLHRWRGQLDYWIFLDGQVGWLQGTIDGLPSAIGVPGLQSTLRVSLIAVDRDRPATISSPGG